MLVNMANFGADVAGSWKSVGLVSEVTDYDYTTENSSMFLNNLQFNEDETVRSVTTDGTALLKWLDNVVINDNDKTASKFLIKDHDGQKYMFYEWKSGDYTIGGQKPSYYVLKKVDSQNPGVVQINYTTSFVANDITINSWRAERVGDAIRFTLNYDNGTLRNYVFFNPPDGSIVKLFGTEQFLVGQGNVVTVDLPISQLQLITEITMKLSLPNTDEANYVFFNTSQLNSLLS